MPGFANSVDRQLLLDEAYSEVYSLNTGIDRNHPFATSLWRESEEINLRSPLYQRLRRFREYRVYELWNISLENFLDLPRETVEYILDECAKELAKRNKSNRKMHQDYEQGLQK